MATSCIQGTHCPMAAAGEEATLITMPQLVIQSPQSARTANVSIVQLGSRAMCTAGCSVVVEVDHDRMNAEVCGWEHQCLSIIKLR